MGSIEERQPQKLPIIDFASWTGNSTVEQRHQVAKELANACHDVGFVYIINHGVTPDLLEEAFTWSKRLFDLETEKKMLAPHPDGPNVHRGYSWPGLEKVSQVISTDMELGERLREVKDCKVIIRKLFCPLMHFLIGFRRVMRSVAMKTMNSPMFGFQTKYFLGSETS